MSRDDEIDYRMMYPLAGRKRKRRAANPRPPKKPGRARSLGGFFSNEPKSIPPKDVTKKASKPTRTCKLGKRYPDDDDGPPLSSMLTLAREMLAKDLDISSADMIRKLEAMGYEAAPTTIGDIRQEMFKLLRLCEKHGSIIVPAWRD
jgi:hypothetical protein